MTPEVVGILSIILMIVLFLIRVPVAFAMGIAGLVGFMFLSDVRSALSLLPQDFYETFSSYPFSVITMFILMGNYSFASGISRKLFDAAYSWIGHIRGGMTIATIFGSAFFGAICGSSTATAATMGKISFPEMKKYNYDDSLATSSIAAGGVLGILIPPSTVFLVYGLLTEQSVGKLFIAGVLPGILLTILFAINVFFLCWRNPALGPPGAATTFKEKLRATKGIIETLILFSLAIGGLFLGWFSPTEAGAIGAGGAILIGVVRRDLNWHNFIEASMDGLRISCMILFIIAGATVFGHLMAITRIPFNLSEWLGELPIPRAAIMGLIIFIYFIGGCFIDAMALIVLTIPIFFPIVIKLGFDPIWFGVVIVLVGGIGVVTPPVGVNVFVIRGISGVPLEVIFKGIWSFVIAILIAIAILMVFPQIATFLPSLISY
jgi:tripartite ATP-independent transporter DctM subunit